MNEQPDEWQRLQELFRRAVQLPPHERAAFAAEASAGDSTLRGELERLLAAHESAGEDHTIAFAPPGAHPLQTPEGLVGHQVGQYRVRRLIGEGGMAVVYEAEQLHPQRTVALKLIKPGFATAAMLERFRHEAQLLGRLQHTGIAQIFEAGTFEAGSSSHPYFAMELIHGRPLAEHATRARLGVRERLALLAEICDAVQHAHQRGVLHRDLKPANILVDEAGHPKILDFGVARAIDSDVQAVTLQTAAGQILGTIPYMSPEQVQGTSADLDTRSDVYALGVVGYELIAEALPYDVLSKPLTEAVTVIRDVDPIPLGAVSKECRGDLETIFSKALEKDPNRRYASAAELAADLRRYLRDEPIAARPPSTFYQLGKFAKRNKELVGGVAAAVLALCVGLIVTSAALLHARTAARRAQKEKQVAVEARGETEDALGTADEVIAFLQDILAGSDPYRALGPDATIRQALDRAAARLDEGNLTPRVEASARRRVGETYESLGLYPEAEHHLRAALAVAEKHLGSDHLETQECRIALGSLLTTTGRAELAKPLLEESLAALSRHPGKDTLLVLDVKNELALTFRDLDRLDLVAKLLQDVLDGRRRLLGERDPKTLQALNNMGMLRSAQGNYEEAEKLLREAARLRGEVLGEDAPSTLISIDNLALILEYRKEYDQAEPLYHRVIAGFRKRLGPDHPDTLKAMYNLGRLLQVEGKLKEAAPILADTLAGRRKRLGDDHPATLYTMRYLGLVYAGLGRKADALALLREATEAVEKRAAGPPWFLYNIPQDYAGVLIEERRFTDAEPVLLHCYETLTTKLGAADAHAQKAARSLAALYEKWGKAGQAAKYRRDRTPKR